MRVVRWLAPALLVVGTGAGACALPREGTLNQNCTTPSECDDDNVCTIDVCSAEGLCAHDPAADGPIADAQQVAGDCLRLECQAGGVTAVPDPTDIKNDANTCTVDSCGPDGPVSTPLPEGTDCDDGNGHNGYCGFTVGSTTVTCQVACTAANAATQCNDANSCTDDSCNVAASLCVHDALDGIAAPGTAQTDGDCRLVVCAIGVETSIADDGDLPDDQNDCTTDVCSGGVPDPVHPPTAANTACDDGGGLYCDGAGSCVACNNDPQCGDATCLCTQCKGNACVAADAASVAACQTPGNCHTVHCDGSGGTTDDVDTSDPPASDNNPCTDDVCQGGTPVHSNNTASCNDGNACTQTDTCAGGSCVGGNPVVCTALDQCHNAGTCNTGTGVCSNPNKNNGTACSDGAYCNGADTCQNGACTGHAGDPCPGADGDGDCSEVCNEAADNCSTNDPNGSACNDGNACTQTDTCLNGNCAGSNPVSCTASDQCHNAGTCNSGTGVCSNPAKANGTACNDGNACTQADTCQSGNCSGANPVVCTASDQCHNVGTCNSGTGVCSNPPKGNGAPCNDGQFCSQTDTCQGGTCTGGATTPCPGHNAPNFCNDSCDETTNDCTALDAVDTSCDVNNNSIFGKCNAGGNCVGD